MYQKLSDFGQSQPIYDDSCPKCKELHAMKYADPRYIY